MKRAILAVLLVCSAAALPADARTVAAQAELATLTQALERVQIDTGFLTSLENLDDVLTSSPATPWQAINDGGGAFMITPGSGAVQRRTLTAGQWWADYMTTYLPERQQPAGGIYDRGTLLDPWGAPYFLYSPLGLYEPESGTWSLRFYGDFFDRYTLVSHGPNRQQGGGDDLLWPMGQVITVPFVSAGGLAPGGSKATGNGFVLRGGNLGGAPGTLVVDGVNQAATFTLWTSTRVEGTTAFPLTSGSSIALRTAGGVGTRAVELLPTLAPSSVLGWELYF